MKISPKNMPVLLVAFAVIFLGIGFYLGWLDNGPGAPKNVWCIKS